MYNYVIKLRKFIKSEAIQFRLSGAYIVISNKLSHGTKIEGKLREKKAKKYSISPDMIRKIIYTEPIHSTPDFSNVSP